MRFRPVGPPDLAYCCLRNRGLRISSFCGELQKAEFERNVIRKYTRQRVF